MELGLLAWRRRQIASISLGGSASVFSRSMKEPRGLMPDLEDSLAALAACWASLEGGGGAAELEGEDEGEAGVMGVLALRRKSSILSL